MGPSPAHQKCFTEICNNLKDILQGLKPWAGALQRRSDSRRKVKNYRNCKE